MFNQSKIVELGSTQYKITKFGFFEGSKLLKKYAGKLLPALMSNKLPEGTDVKDIKSGKIKLDISMDRIMSALDSLGDNIIQEFCTEMFSRTEILEAKEGGESKYRKVEEKDLDFGVLVFLAKEGALLNYSSFFDQLNALSPEKEKSDEVQEPIPITVPE